MVRERTLESRDAMDLDLIARGIVSSGFNCRLQGLDMIPIGMAAAM